MKIKKQQQRNTNARKALSFNIVLFRLLKIKSIYTLESVLQTHASFIAKKREIFFHKKVDFFKIEINYA